MESLPSCEIFEFNQNQLVNVRKEFGYENTEQMNTGIDSLDDWIRKQNHFLIRNFDRCYLEHYLIANKGSLEKTKKRFDSLCTLRNLMPEFLRNFDLKTEFAPVFECIAHALLPKPTPDNCRVMVFTIHDPEKYDSFSLLHYCRFLSAATEYLFGHDYNSGYEVIVDMRNLNFGLLKKMNPFLLQKALTIVLEAYGLRIKSFHLIVIKSKVADTIEAIIRQALSEKISKRLILHNTHEQLYDYIPKKILPKDLGGGEDKTIKEISDRLYREVTSDEHVERMQFIETVRTDEKLRLSSKFNEEYCGMPGSFKTLCVD